jgi:hypothetical protein
MSLPTRRSRSLPEGGSAPGNAPVRPKAAGLSNQVVRGKAASPHDDLNPIGLHQGFKPAGLWPAVMLEYPGNSHRLAAAQVQGNDNPVLLAGSIQPQDPDLDRCSETVRTSLKAVDLPIPAPNFSKSQPPSAARAKLADLVLKPNAQATAARTMSRWLWSARVTPLG